MPDMKWIRWNQTKYDASEVFYTGCSQEIKDEAVAKIERCFSLACLSDGGKCDYPAWKGIESSYLVCGLDQAVLLSAQEWMSNQEGGKWKRVKNLLTGHSPFLCMPDETAMFVRQCAAEKV